MFLRLVTHSVRMTESETMAEAYRRSVVPALRSATGCLFASFLHNVSDRQEAVSLTIWKDRMDSIAYEESGLYLRLVETLRPYFNESSGWRLELSEDLSLAVSPTVSEPTVRRFDDTTQGLGRFNELRLIPYVVVILSVPVREDAGIEFEHVVMDVMRPAYAAAKGFIDLIRVRREREQYLLTFWDETVDIRTVAAIHSLDTVHRAVSPFVPSHVRWRDPVEGSSATSASTEAVSSAVYRCLIAEWL